MTPGSDGGGATAVRSRSVVVRLRENARFMIAAAAGFAALAGIYLGADRLPVSPVARILFSELAFTLPILFVVFTGARAFRISRGAEARFWLLLTGANAVLLTSELYYMWWLLAYGSPPPPVYAPFQVLHIAASIFFIALMLSMSRFSSATMEQRGRVLLDGAAVMTILYVLIMRLLIVPLFSAVPGAQPIDFIAGAAYPLFGVVMIGGTLAIVLGLKVSGWRMWERFVALSLVIYAGGIAAWPLWYVSFKTGPASAVERGVLDLVLVMGHYLLVLATSYRLTRRSQAWPLRPVPLFQPSGGRRLGVVVPGLTLAALPVMVYLGVTGRPGSVEQTVHMAAAVLLAGISVGRTALVAVENGRLFHHATTDPLTRLFNHRFMHERLVLEVDIARRYDEQLSLLDLDIDGFDLVNDTSGHPAGDEMLVAIAGAVKASCRPTDAVCRVGGDRFAVIMPGAGGAEALRTAIAIQRRVRGIQGPGGVNVTVSAGVATFPGHAKGAEQLVTLAHGALYWAKCHGRDQVLVYDPDIVKELGPDDRIRSIEEESHLGTVRALATAVDARHGYTRFHSRNVAALAAGLAGELGMSAERIRLLETAALLHDVGMIGVSDAVLRNPGPLSEEEWEDVRSHPALGVRILGSTNLDETLPWIRHHHERWDGGGYPDGLRAVAIPLEARVLAVCDAYDAMTSDRAHRAALSGAEAIEQLKAGSGTQFDPAVVEVFLASIGHASRPE